MIHVPLTATLANCQENVLLATGVMTIEFLTTQHQGVFQPMDISKIQSQFVPYALKAARNVSLYLFAWSVLVDTS